MMTAFMNIFLDRGVATLLFAPGTAVVLGAWLGLFGVHWALLMAAFPAMVLGGLGLAFQYLFDSGS